MIHHIFINKLSNSSKRVLADKFMELGNIATGALIFSQILDSDTNSAGILIGLLIIFLTYGSAILYLL